MTLGEGKNRVYMLLDEYSAGGSVTRDQDIEAKMVSFFDIAQKQVAQYKKIVRLATIEHDESAELYAMPEDFGKLYRIWRDGREATGRYRWKGGRLVVPASDSSVIEVEYFAIPATIPSGADESYEFEVSEDAAQCMPFFVAAQQLAPDLVVDYSVFLQFYQLALGNLNTALDGDYNQKTINNTFYLAH